MKLGLLIVAGTALCTLAEGADERLLREIEDAQSGVMQQCIPVPSVLLTRLVQQADIRKTLIRVSVTDELFKEYELDKLTGEAQSTLTSLYRLQGRAVTFLDGALVVHPHEKIEKNLRMGPGGFYLKHGTKRVA